MSHVEGLTSSGNSSRVEKKKGNCHTLGWSAGWEVSIHGVRPFMVCTDSGGMSVRKLEVLGCCLTLNKT
jgi:hypothetical protein